MKENLNRAMAGEVDDCLDLEATHHVHCGQTEDHREAAKAFVDKREPVFNGGKTGRRAGQIRLPYRTSDE